MHRICIAALNNVIVLPALRVPPVITIIPTPAQAQALPGSSCILKLPIPLPHNPFKKPSTRVGSTQSTELVIGRYCYYRYCKLSGPSFAELPSAQQIPNSDIHLQPWQLGRRPTRHTMRTAPYQHRQIRPTSAEDTGQGLSQSTRACLTVIQEPWTLQLHRAPQWRFRRWQSQTPQHTRAYPRKTSVPVVITLLSLTATPVGISIVQTRQCHNRRR